MKLFWNIKHNLDKYLKWSPFYNWMIKNIEIGFKVPTQTYYGQMHARKMKLCENDEYKKQFEGWNFPEDLDLDNMFYAEKMPMVFDDAVAITDHVISVFKQETLRHGAEFMIVAAENCSFTPSSKGGRRIIERGYFKKLLKISENHQIPLLDLYESFSQKGDVNLARWKHDGHWNQTGHMWAAEALFTYFKRDFLSQGLPKSSSAKQEE